MSSSTFTITQTPISQNAIFYPNGSSATQLTSYGNIENYYCVDDTFDASDDDITYVYTTGISVVSDMYTFTDHTTESGVINNIILYCRAKSHIYPQASSGTYDLKIRIGGIDFRNSSTTYGSPKYLSTDYNLFSTTWTSNPSTLSAWTWTDVDNIIAGFECSSPTAPGVAKQLIIRPNANGDYIALTSGTGQPNYTNVDEEIQDEDTTYNYSTGIAGSTDYDIYVVPNHTTETGFIDNIIIYNLAKKNHANNQYGNDVIKIWGGTYYSNDYDLNTIYNMHSTIWSSKPSDSSIWDWSDIDNLQIGFRAKKAWAELVFLTQTYGIVNYKEDVNPQIRTTQCYLKVNYTPGSSYIYPKKPTNYTIKHDREIKKHNFWNNERVVYDLYRTSKTLSMEGIEFNRSESEATVIIKNWKIMKDNGSPITISGMDDGNLNRSWLIKSFNYSKDTSNINIYNWNMECEEV